jgi:hypothetical protein
MWCSGGAVQYGASRGTSQSGECMNVDRVLRMHRASRTLREGYREADATNASAIR